ncbi:MAG: Hpt domain-containing protein [Treponema sp.]|jgi:HPt (histidine-containing phosphotransfer) domain-containing protein|nr:Hpt domain-containing protein [Treponema sp.]
MAEEKVYINFDEGMKRIMNNGKLYIRLLGKFKSDTTMPDLELRLSAGDLEGAQALAHTLKGLAANLSLTELFEQIRDLESRIKERAVPEDALDTVKSVYAETLKRLDEVIAKYVT